MTTTDYEIRYQRTSHDYDVLVENRYIGSRETYLAGETLAREYIFDLLQQTACDTADQEALVAEQASTEAPLWACKACGGAHHIQACPEIAAQLHTPHVPRHIAALTKRITEMQPVRDDRRSLLRFEAERLHGLLTVMTGLAVGTPDYAQLRRLANRAHWRIMRRMVSARCDGAQFPCDKPATRSVYAKTGDDMETARTVMLHYCESCFHELYDEISTPLQYEPKELIAA